NFIFQIQIYYLPNLFFFLRIISHSFSRLTYFSSQNFFLQPKLLLDAASLPFSYALISSFLRFHFNGNGDDEWESYQREVLTAKVTTGAGDVKSKKDEAG
ncbi:hypothetical protein LINGRAHAP2_LOCUS6469, partial [Linum grandiflorum]